MMAEAAAATADIHLEEPDDFPGAGNTEQAPYFLAERSERSAGAFPEHLPFRSRLIVSRSNTVEDILEAISSPARPIRPEVEKLIEEDHGPDETDDMVVALQAAIRSGEHQVLDDLRRVFFSGALDGDQKGVVLDTIAGSGSPEAEELAIGMIRSCLAAADEDLRFAGIAAAGELRPVRRAELRFAISAVGQMATATSSVARAALAFLRT